MKKFFSFLVVASSLLLLLVIFGSGGSFFLEEETEAPLEAVAEIGPKEEEKVFPEVILESVPFTSQAPFAGWDDPRQQDACEEASVLMAVYWGRGQQSLTKKEALEQILAASAYQQEEFGESRDTSAQGTVSRLFQGYFNYPQAEAKSSIVLADILVELKKGNLVILPLNGQIIGNPNFTQPGPERHMLVIRGYDFNLKEFITNDPGTRKGEGYRYPEKILFQAIRDYPTGYHEPFVNSPPIMIVVGKEK